MRETTSDFITEKNKAQNEPIFLYIIYDIDGAGTNKYYTSYSSNITFDGITYERFPIRHNPISENTKGSIDQLTISLSNVSRLIRFYLGQYDGLRDKKVTIRQVFSGLLSNPNAKIDDTYYVSQVSSNSRDVSLTLTSKFDILNVSLPRRIYTRNEFPGIPHQRTIIL